MVRGVPKQARLVYVTPSHQYPLGVTEVVAATFGVAGLGHEKQLTRSLKRLQEASSFRRAGVGNRCRHWTRRVAWSMSVHFSKTLLPDVAPGIPGDTSIHAGSGAQGEFVTDWHTFAGSQHSVGVSSTMVVLRGIYASRSRLRGTSSVIRNILTEEFSDT